MTQSPWNPLLLAALLLVACDGSGNGNGSQPQPQESDEDGGLVDPTRDAAAELDATTADDSGTHAPADSGASGDAGESEADLIQKLVEDAPECPKDPSAHIEGHIEGMAVSRLITDLIPSTLYRGRFYSLDRGPDNEIYNYLHFRWSNQEPRGTFHRLTGDMLVADVDAFPMGAYCVVSGYLVAAPAQPGGGALFYYRITRVRERTSWDEMGGTCVGPELEADIVGCFKRGSSRPELP